VNYGKERAQSEISYITSGCLQIYIRPLAEKPRFFLPAWLNPHKTRETPGNCTLLSCKAAALVYPLIAFLSLSTFNKLCYTLLVSQINSLILTPDKRLMQLLGPR
jgi:hypothetical protein